MPPEPSAPPPQSKEPSSGSRIPADKPKNTTAEFNRLINDAPTMDLNIYILKYASITESLVAKGALSTLHRVSRLMDGLPGDLPKRVLKFCTSLEIVRARYGFYRSSF